MFKKTPRKLTMKKHSARGFAIIELLLLTIVIALISGLGFYLYKVNNKTKNNTKQEASVPQKVNAPVVDKPVVAAPKVTTFENDNLKLTYPNDWGWQRAGNDWVEFCANSPEANANPKACYTGAYDSGATMEVELNYPATNNPKIDSVNVNHDNRYWTITKQGWTALNGRQVYQFEIDASGRSGPSPVFHSIYTRIPYPNSETWLEFNYSYRTETGDKYNDLYQQILQSVELKSSKPHCCG